MKLRNQIENYIPYNEQEVADKKYFLKFIDTFEDVLTRDNQFGHFSVGAFVVNPDRTKMLMVYHNIYNAWVWPGGHADGEEDLLKVTIREVEEETGLKVTPVSENIFSIQTLPVQGHIKKENYIPSHTHLDVVFLLEADDKIPLVYRDDESKGVKWVSFEEATDETMCDYIRPIHKKLIKKLINK